MTGGLPDALETLLTTSLPGLFGGGAVGLSVVGGLLEIDQEQSADATASEPRPDDRVDDLGFDPDDPAGPYTLTQPPYPGPRRVWLVTGAADRLSLRSEEVVWDRTDARVFSLALRPQRDVSAVTGIRVLYGVTAVYTKVKAVQTLDVRLTASDSDLLERAESLVVAVIQLNRQRLADEARAIYEDGDYGAAVELKNVGLVRGTTPEDDVRQLLMRAELELKASRALGEDEGAPIERILTPGRPPDPDRPIDVHIDVEA
ncbi:MAG TPA: hypothetical protein VHM16_08250 [Rubrobacteraceae bacterium]|nr:hypothetical protein [Rubrobacteraceae bacterium]